MKLKVISTGSKGNCYILKNETSALVIEAGVNFSEVKKAINFADWQDKVRDVDNDGRVKHADQMGMARHITPIESLIGFRKSMQDAATDSKIIDRDFIRDI